MKKKILMMAIALLGITGMSATAQTSRNNNAAQATPGAMNKMRQPREFSEFAFEGILLDLNQQQRMDSLNAAVKANRPCQPAGDCDMASCDKKCDNQNSQCCQQQGQCKGQGEAKPNGKAPKGHGMRPGMPYDKDYIAKVKEILTPDQYTMFLENIVMMPQNMQPQAPGFNKNAKMTKAGKPANGIKMQKAAQKKSK